MKNTALILFFAFILIGCSNSEAAIERQNETINLYNKNCAGCHGLDLNGTAVANGVKGFSKNEILESIASGDVGMQANILVGEDAKRVAAWIAKQ